MTDPGTRGTWERLFAGAIAAYAYNAIVGHVPSRHVRHAFLKRWFGEFGTNSGVQLGCRFLNGRKIALGPHCVINFGTLIDGRRFPVTIGANVSIGPEAAILTLGHEPQSPDFADRGGAVRIGDRAWIGYRAVIMPGVTIGEGAVVAAGAVVSGDVPAFAIVAGNPARQVGARTRELAYTLDFRPWLI